MRILGEPVFDGEAGGRRARLYPELGVDRVKMPLDRTVAYEEHLRHLGVGEATSNQLQHFGLPLAQARHVGEPAFLRRGRTR
jgi:hypothetical protein